MSQEKPTFKDILDVIERLPAEDGPQINVTDPMTYLNEWLSHYSRTLDLSRGFLVNRCALYWAGYDATDAFDGQAFVDSCQDSKGSLRELAQILDTDLQIFELDPQTHAKRDADEIAMAASYGMMAVEESTQLFCMSGFGQGVEANAKNALSTLSSLRPNAVSGGSSAPTKQDPLTRSEDLDQNDDGAFDLETFLTNHCGLDIAAMIGAACASILKGIPVIAEGSAGRLVKSILQAVTGYNYASIIATDDLNFPLNHSLPGQKMIMTAIMLKTLYIAQQKTDCGKIKNAA